MRLYGALRDIISADFSPDGRGWAYVMELYERSRPPCRERDGPPNPPDCALGRLGSACALRVTSCTRRCWGIRCRGPHPTGSCGSAVAIPSDRGTGCISSRTALTMSPVMAVAFFTGLAGAQERIEITEVWTSEEVGGLLLASVNGVAETPRGMIWVSDTRVETVYSVNPRADSWRKPVGSTSGTPSVWYPIHRMVPC